MKPDFPVLYSPRIEVAIEAIKGMIGERFPQATFSITEGDAPPAFASSRPSTSTTPTRCPTSSPTGWSISRSKKVCRSTS